jgi:hypothetical protein
MPKSDIAEAARCVAEAEERFALHSARFEILRHYGCDFGAIRKARARLTILEHTMTLATAHLRLKWRR